MLALSHKLVIKDRLTRAGRWADRLDYMGVGTTGRTLGVVGLGNIGCEVLKLAEPFGMNHIACDPYATKKQAAEVNAQLMDLESLLKVADFVAICCSLTDETHHLINAERLDLMRPSAFLINVARGPIVDQLALTTALQTGQIQGAGLDVFEQEPIDPSDPLLSLENVILSPHALCWTDECFLGNGQSACRSILDAASGRTPNNIVNGEVLLRTDLTEKLAQFAEPVFS
jgi:phosphoglycerate dehydrogenase-like enzyme